MKSGKVICLLAAAVVVVSVWFKNMPLPQKTPQETAFCDSLQKGKLDFKEGFLYERFISSEEFETLQNVRIALKRMSMSLCRFWAAKGLQIQLSDLLFVGRMTRVTVFFCIFREIGVLNGMNSVWNINMPGKRSV